MKYDGIVKIERGIPVPQGRAKYPWRQLQIGESFLAPVRYTSLANGRVQAQRITGFKFRMKPEKEGTRVWRIK